MPLTFQILAQMYGPLYYQKECTLGYKFPFYIWGKFIVYVELEAKQASCNIFVHHSILGLIALRPLQVVSNSGTFTLATVMLSTL